MKMLLANTIIDSDNTQKHIIHKSHINPAVKRKDYAKYKTSVPNQIRKSVHCCESPHDVCLLRFSTIKYSSIFILANTAILID